MLRHDRVPSSNGKQPKAAPVLFASVGFVPFRDDREGMSVPLVSLSKAKRVAPIHWQSSDGERFVTVTANAAHGMATIWDLDVLIWAVSQINDAIETDRGVSRTLQFRPHDMLKTIGRPVGGDHYNALRATLDRLAGTQVETNIRADKEHNTHSFTLLEEWSQNMNSTITQDAGMIILVPSWIFDGVAQHRDVLAISPSYFKLSSGIARWLYRLARRHAGKQPAGWRFTMKNLHARSGSIQPLHQFARDVRHIVRDNNLPEYRLDLLRGQRGDEIISMLRDPSKMELPQRRDIARL
jgi:plasmid replication initiation protein